MQTRFLTLAMLASLVSACGGSGQGGQTASSADRPAAKPVAKTDAPAAVPTRPKTEVLPADGGDVGKAYNELVAAYQAVDSARANRLVDNRGVTPDPLEKKDADSYLSDMLKVYPAGGLRQADRATLFLDGGKWHGSYSASLVGSGWVFDMLNPATWQDDPHEPAPDCKASKLFPCGARTFSDAQVSGSATIYRGAPNNNDLPSSGVLLDGFGVRMLDAKTRALQYTQIVLSNTAFEPHLFASTMDSARLSEEMGTVQLNIAADGKSAKLIFVNATQSDKHPEIDATKELTVDASTPNRMRGQLKMDAKNIAQIDVTFDVGTASECLLHESRCGNL